jgi:hypothetical protein
MDSTGKMVICCVHVALLHAMYGGTLARWMTPGLGFCRAIKFQGKEGLLLFRRVENICEHEPDRETLQPRRHQNSVPLGSWLGLYADCIFPWHQHLHWIFQRILGIRSVVQA